MILRNGVVRSSYSQIQKYLSCPYQWQLRYIDEIKEEIKSKHLDYGNAIHETLEFIFEFYQGFGELPSIDDSLDFLADMIINKYDVQFDSEDETIEWIDRAKGTINELYNSEGIYDLILNSEIVGVELPFELEMEIPEREYTNKNGEVLETDTVKIIGFIDLVLKTDEGYIVIDHKSGGKKFDKAKLRKDLQLPIYGLVIKQMFGEMPIEGYYNFTRLGIHQRVLYAEEVTIEMNETMNKRSPKEIYCVAPEQAKMEVRRVFADMYKTNQPANPTFLCNYCDYRDICSHVNHNPKFKK